MIADLTRAENRRHRSDIGFEAVRKVAINQLSTELALILKDKIESAEILKMSVDIRVEMVLPVTLPSSAEVGQPRANVAALPKPPSDELSTQAG